MERALIMPLPDQHRAHRNELLMRALCFGLLMLAFALMGEAIRP